MKTRHYVTLVIVAAVAACINVWLRWDDGATGGRIAVRGDVTLDGKPLKSGRIQFTPDRNTAAPAVPGTIENGNFHIRAAQGLLPGTYTVTIMLPQRSALHHAPSTLFGKTGKIFHWPEPQRIRSDVKQVVLRFPLPPPDFVPPLTAGKQ
jgi:hypothetical protein